MPDLNLHNVVDGRPTHVDERMELTDPATGEVYGTAPRSTAADVDAAVLNHRIPIGFVPQFERPSPWPPVDFDKPGHRSTGACRPPQRARLGTVLFGLRYVVMPDAHRTGQVERISAPPGSVRRRTRHTGDLR